MQSLSVQFDVAIQATRAATQAAIVAAAKAANAEIMAREPRPSIVVRHVDGREGAPEEAVKPDGVIVYDYSRIDQIVAFAMKTLFDRSPVKTGNYRDNHTLMHNGEIVDAGRFAGFTIRGDTLAGWKPGDDVMIVNFVDYARVIEVGAMKMRVPGTDHVYQQAQQIVAAAHPEASVTFTYRNIEGGRVSASRGHKGGNRYPALVIRER